MEREALAPFDRGARRREPYKVQHDLQATMQDLVGIVRTDSEMREALTRLDGYQARAAQVGVTRPPRVPLRLAHGARPAKSADGV